MWTNDFEMYSQFDYRYNKYMYEESKLVYLTLIY